MLLKFLQASHSTGYWGEHMNLFMYCPMTTGLQCAIVTGESRCGHTNWYGRTEHRQVLLVLVTVIG